MNTKNFSILLIIFLVISFLSCGNEEKNRQSESVQPIVLPDEGIKIENAWARPGSKNGVSAIYMTVLNGSSEADTLVSVTSPGARMVEIHESYESEESMMGMREAKQVIAPSRDVLRLEPGGLHIMLMQLNRELKESDGVEFTVKFANAGEMKVTALVQSMQ